MPPSSILTKAMSLLDLIAASPTPLTLAEISDKSGLPKSSTHRLLVLLRDAAALTYDTELQHYLPGSRLMRWGVQTLQTNNLATLSTPYMKSLCRETGMRIALSILDGNVVLYLHTAETGMPYRLAPRVGQHSPLHASAAGKLFLAGMSSKARANILANYEFEQCTEFTITDPQNLIQEIEQVQQDGFSVSAREEFRQICGLAVPIIGTNGATLAALSIWNVGGMDLLEALKAHHKALKNTVSEIQLSLGHTI